MCYNEINKDCNKELGGAHEKSEQRQEGKTDRRFGSFRRPRAFLCVLELLGGCRQQFA